MSRCACVCQCLSCREEREKDRAILRALTDHLPRREMTERDRMIFARARAERMTPASPERSADAESASKKEEA